MQTVLLLAEADWKAWEIEGTEWKLATRNSLKGEKRALQCELIFSWFLFILQIPHSNRTISRFVCSPPIGDLAARKKFTAPSAAASPVRGRW